MFPDQCLLNLQRAVMINSLLASARGSARFSMCALLVTGFKRVLISGGRSTLLFRSICGVRKRSG